MGLFYACEMLIFRFLMIQVDVRRVTSLIFRFDASTELWVTNLIYAPNKRLVDAIDQLLP